MLSLIRPLRRYARFWVAGLLALTLIGPILAVAQDSASTPEATFVDSTPPAMGGPGDLWLAAEGGGATAWFEVYANDETDGPVGVSCAPASGSWFPLGQSWVQCSAWDSAGNPGSYGFSVIVVDQIAPVINWPADVAAMASDPSGTAVYFDVPAAFDNVDGQVPVACDAASGAWFPVGATTVTCWAQDSSGNQASAVAFGVYVEYLPPPTEVPTEEPTAEPTPEPTEVPTEEPTEEPTDEPTAEPTDEPADEMPTTNPTEPTDSGNPAETPVTQPTDPGNTGGTGSEPTAVPSAPVVIPPPVVSSVDPIPAIELPDSSGQHRPAPVVPTEAASPVRDALELPAVLPPAIRVTGSGPIDSLDLIWGHEWFSISQEFGHTDFSISHASWYSYGTAYGLDGMMHPGLDIAMPAGTPLYSPVNGTVMISGGVPFFTFYGNGAPGVGELLIQTDEGHQVVLGHMGRIAVQVGQRVTVGEFVGLSGGDNGDHLHLEVREASGGGYRIVDPRYSFLTGAIAGGVIGDTAFDDLIWEAVRQSWWS